MNEWQAPDDQAKRPPEAEMIAQQLKARWRAQRRRSPARWIPLILFLDVAAIIAVMVLPGVSPEARAALATLVCAPGEQLMTRPITEEGNDAVPFVNLYCLGSDESAYEVTGNVIVVLLGLGCALGGILQFLAIISLIAGIFSMARALPEIREAARQSHTMTASGGQSSPLRQEDDREQRIREARIAQLKQACEAGLITRDKFEDQIRRIQG
jgi:hypothetical protein